MIAQSAASITLLFPAVLIVLDLAAAVVYGWYGDWRHGIYWTAAAVLTLCVVWP